MNFSEIIKTAILQIINSYRFSDIFIGEVIQEYPTKIKLNDKLILDDDYIIKSRKFSSRLSLGEKVILIRQGGGQKYFAIDYTFKEEE